MSSIETAIIKAHLRLAAALLAQAAADAAAGDETARDFLLSPQVELILARLGLSVEYCRRLVAMPAHSGAGPAGEWLTVAQAAACCKCHPETIRQRIRSGHLQARGGGRGRGWWVLADGLQDTT